MRIRLPYWFFFTAVPALTSLFGCDALRLDRASAPPEFTWTLAPDIGLADGQSPIRVALSVHMQDGGPMAQVPLILTSDEPSDNIVQPGLTDAYGRAQADITASVQGLHHLAVWLDDGLARKELDAKIQIKFGAVTSGNANAPDTPIPLKLEILATPTDGDPDPLAPTQFTLVVTDPAGMPIAQQFVTFMATRPNDILTPTSGVTDSKGRFVVTLTAGSLGSAGVQVQAGTLVAQSTINVVAGAANLGQSSLLAANTTPIADGRSPLALTVRLRDAYQNPVANALVAFSSTVGSDVFASPTAVTGADGQATSSVKAMASGDRQLRARAAGFLLTANGSFKAGPVVAATSTLTASPNAVAADGNSPATLLLIARDAYGNGVPNAAVSWSSDPGGGVFTPPTTQTNTQGHAEGTVTSTRAQDQTIVAHCAGKRISASVRFYPGPLDGNQSSMVVLNDVRPADGHSTVSVTVSLDDAWGNGLPNIPVQLTTFGNPARLTARSGSTNDFGQFTTTLVSDYAGVHPITAQSGSVQLMGLAHFAARTPSCAGNVFLGGVPILQASEGAALSQPAAADLNADGHMDVITANASVNSISVFFGQGNGAFALRQDYPVGETPSAIAVADFDSDGRLDLVVANNVDNTISVLLQQDQDSFASAVPYPLVSEGKPLNMVVADLNGDGFQDVVTANQSGTVSIFLGRGDGTFVSIADVFATYGNVRAVAVSDLNHDGVQDIVTANYDVNAISVLLGKGDGTFSTAVNYPVGNNPFDIVIEDFNQDGHDDVATADYSSDTVSILLGRGDGSLLSSNPISVGDGPVKIAVLDLNGDGNKDIIALNYNDNTLSVLLSQGNLIFSPTQYNVDRPVGYGLLTVDITSDGNPDVLVVDYFKLVVTGQGDGKGGFVFPSRSSYAVESYPSFIITPDLNHDGKPDIAVVNTGSDSVSILLADQAGGFFPAAHYPSGPQPQFSAAGNLNDDGFVDLVIANGTGTVSILMGQGDGTLAPPVSYASGESTIAVIIADINGDSFMDILSVNYDDATLSAFLGLGNGVFQPASHYSVGSGPINLISFDLNNDGLSDVVTVNYDDTVSVFLGNRDGNLVGPISYPVPHNLYGAATGDFDEDGFVDIIVKDYNSKDFFVLRNNGDGTIQPATLWGTGGLYGDEIIIEDFNRDGHLDVMIPSRSGTVVLYPGLGDGTFLSPTAFISSSGTKSSGCAVDTNGDGNIDVIVTDSTNQTVNVLSHLCPLP